MGRLWKCGLALLVAYLLLCLFFWYEESSRQVAARRFQSASNLRQIGLGLIAYHDQFHRLPPGSLYAPGGSPLHGWPTLILPFIDNAGPYDQINLARPWDDPTPLAPGRPSNRDVTALGIGIYKIPGVGASGTARSPYLGFATNAWINGGPRSMRLDQITDGAARTILLGEAAGDYRPWGSPAHWRDPSLGINKTPSGFGGPFRGGANFLFVDGSVKFLRDEMSMVTFRALATPDGGEKVDVDELE